MRALNLLLGLLGTGAHASSLSSLSTGMSGASFGVMSKEQIMSTLTNQRALDIVLHSNRINENPKLVALLQNELAEHIRRSNGTEVKVANHHEHRGKQTQDPPKGYAALDGARKMLNEMLNDAQAKLDNEFETCTTYNRETLGLLEEIRQDVASFNAQAAEARGRVLKNQGIIAFCNLKLPEVTEELEEHNQECTRHASEISSQIDIVTGDLQVMGGILEIIGNCDAAGAAALVQCRHCRKTGEGYVMLQDDKLQPLLNQLKSAAAKRVLQENLGEMYEQVTNDADPEALTQEQVHRQLMLMTGKAVGERQLRGQQDPNNPELMASMGNLSLNISEVPQVTVPVDCIPTEKCTLGKGSCVKIRDRFLFIQSGIQDMLNTLKADLAELERSCLEDRTVMEGQIADLGDKLRVSQTELAVATKDQVDSESSSNLKAQQHTEVTHEYGATMKECCDEQNDLKSEICAITKIRGELYKMKGQTMFITDCQVSDFAEGECSASCGGGTLTKTRSILVHPVNGMACPPLELKDSCNTHPCPIDCKLGEWEGWSACSAECGGGVREKMRPVLRESKYDGEPCEDTEETEGCNSFSCNRDCILEEWSRWGACTQACWGGTERRARGVKEEARGQGTCAEADSESRLHFRKCNDIPCERFYSNTIGGQKFLQCGSKIDMVILMDGSGSLGNLGWMQSQVFVSNLLKNLKGDDKMVRVAVMLFSGPTTWPAYERCTGNGAAPDLVKDCGIVWVKHFTNDTLQAARAVEALKFPAATTLTSVALGEAEQELINGREDANSVVVVVTDGAPLSQTQTEVAAGKLKEKARVVWVPVGPGAPYELIEKLASLPKNENIIAIDAFAKMGMAFFANKVIAQTCPVLFTPPALGKK